MLRKVASKVAWVGRTASMVFGLALVLALVFGALSVALAHTGSEGLLHLNHNNLSSALTTLTGNVNGATMKVVNNNAGTDDTALELSVQSGEAPMKVNSRKVVSNLNADRLDGFDASAFDTSNTGKIHRIGPATRLDGGEISLITMGPYQLVGECGSVGTTRTLETAVTIAADGRPSYGAVMSTGQSGIIKWAASPDLTRATLFSSSGANVTDTATGYVYTSKSLEPSFTFHLYHNRSTNSNGQDLCTFGGYVVEDV